MPCYVVQTFVSCQSWNPGVTPCVSNSLGAYLQAGIFPQHVFDCPNSCLYPGGRNRSFCSKFQIFILLKYFALTSLAEGFSVSASICYAYFEINSFLFSVVFLKPRPLLLSGVANLIHALR